MTGWYAGLDGTEFHPNLHTRRNCSKYIENIKKHTKKNCASSWVFTKMVKLYLTGKYEDRKPNKMQQLDVYY